ncbi:hypothetical protein CEXT_277561 [Caerostris extrusa]|uniref:Uncharacterized protein n=1 Tax=Caerostris extrusa TaxID=172846 RepID=A0AAV4NWZ4_CAEEX|nr:hypothetical protein CEXT_277561 [Caerostris extrusa]
MLFFSWHNWNAAEGLCPARRDRAMRMSLYQKVTRCFETEAHYSKGSANCRDCWQIWCNGIASGLWKIYAVNKASHVKLRVKKYFNEGHFSLLGQLVKNV